MSNMAANLVLVASLWLFHEPADDDNDANTWLGLLATIARMRNDHYRIQHFYETTIPGYLPDTFRMSRTSFQLLFQHLAGCNEFRPRQYQGERQEVTCEKAVLMVFRYLASQETQFEICDKSDVTEFTFLKYRSMVIGAINRTLLLKFISWPNVNQYNDIVREFNFLAGRGFPNIIGAVDGTRVRIDPPAENPNAYYNRKKFHSIILQAVYKHDLLFTSIYVGWPGRVHNAKVLRHSNLWETDEKCQFGNFHILGDGAYPLQRWLLTPYRDNGHLTQEELRYNEILSSKRQVIERAFGLLKGRFRRLKHINMRNVPEICDLIMAACILHNICIMSGEEFQDFLEADDDQIENQQAQLNNVPQNNIPAQQKRRLLTQQL